MGSIKFKFTAFVTVAIASIVLLFSGIIYYSNIATQQREFTFTVLQELAVDRPNLNRFIARSGDPIRLIELAQVISASSIAEANKTLSRTIPPVVILGSLVALIVSAYLVAPIEKMSFAIRKLGSKNISKRLPVLSSSTEIEILTSRINQLMDELEGAFKVQEQFVGDAAHELRTPLAAIKAQIDVQKESKKKPSVEFVETIERLNSQLITLNEKLLFLHRGHGRDRVERVNIKTIVEEVLEILEPMAQEQGVKIINKIKENGLYIDADPSDVVLIVRNLVENSIKYRAEDNPEVTIDIRQNKNSFKITISDNGIGIPADALQSIFRRFYRASNASKKAVSGDGLGLSIVKKVISAYGGSIEVESTINKGTEVTLEFFK